MDALHFAKAMAIFPVWLVLLASRKDVGPLHEEAFEAKPKAVFLGLSIWTLVLATIGVLEATRR